MANLADSNSAGRRRGGDVGAAGRPVFLCEISRCGPQLCLRKGSCHPGHDVVVTSFALELSQLLEEVIFLQTPDDRGGRSLWNAVHAMACAANQELGAEDGLGLSGISSRCHRGSLGDMSRRMGGTLRGICRRAQRDENGQNAENSRKMIVDHDYPAIVVRGHAVL